MCEILQLVIQSCNLHNYWMIISIQVSWLILYLKRLLITYIWSTCTYFNWNSFPNRLNKEILICTNIKNHLFFFYSKKSKGTFKYASSFLNPLEWVEVNFFLLYLYKKEILKIMLGVKIFLSCPGSEQGQNHIVIN